MFLLALTFGLDTDVFTGVARMAGLVEYIAAEHNIDEALQMTLGISNGESLYAARYSTVGKSRSLYYSASHNAAMEIAPGIGKFSSDARAIVSEPLSSLASEWVPVPEASFLTITRGEISCKPFAPIPP